MELRNSNPYKSGISLGLANLLSSHVSTKRAPVEYEPQRLEQFLEMDQQDVASNVRYDFSLLKLPHPPERNIRDPTWEGIRVSWSTTPGSTLYLVVRRVVESQNLDVNIRQTKDMCRIKNISYHQVPCSPGRVRETSVEKKRDLTYLRQRRDSTFSQPRRNSFRDYRRSHSPGRIRNRETREPSPERRRHGTRSPRHSSLPRERRSSLGDHGKSRSPERRRKRERGERSSRQHHESVISPDTGPVGPQRSPFEDSRMASSPERTRPAKKHKVSSQRHRHGPSTSPESSFAQHRRSSREDHRRSRSPERTREREKYDRSLHRRQKHNSSSPHLSPSRHQQTIFRDHRWSHSPGRGRERRKASPHRQKYGSVHRDFTASHQRVTSGDHRGSRSPEPTRRETKHDAEPSSQRRQHDYIPHESNPTQHTSIGDHHAPSPQRERPSSQRRKRDSITHVSSPSRARRTPDGDRRRSRSLERARQRMKREPSPQKPQHNPSHPRKSTPVAPRQISFRGHRISPTRELLGRRISRFGSPTTVKRIDSVMQSLRDLDASLQTVQTEEPSMVAEASSIPFSGIPPRPPTPMHVLPQKPAARRRIGLEADLSKIRQDLTAMILRAAALEEQQKQLAAPIEPFEPGDDIRTRLVKATTDLVLERQKRREAELVLFDVKRECDQPVVIPGMLEYLEHLKDGFE